MNKVVTLLIKAFALVGAAYLGTGCASLKRVDCERKVFVDKAGRYNGEMATGDAPGCQVMSTIVDTQ